MKQEAPHPGPPPATPPGPVTPATPWLEYGPRAGARLSVSEYLTDFTASATLVAVILFLLHYMDAPAKGVYRDFGLKLPAATMLLLDISDASRACYGWVVLALVPFAAPFLLAKLRPGARRWVAALAILLTGLFTIFAVLALFLPIATLMRRLSGKP